METLPCSYDAAGNVTGLHSTDDVGANISNFTWAYDAANRLSSEVRNGGTPTTYGYDDANQLTNEVSGFIGPISFTYDGTGNRTNGSYDPDVGNRLASDAPGITATTTKGMKRRRSASAMA